MIRNFELVEKEYAEVKEKYLQLRKEKYDLMFEKILDDNVGKTFFELYDIIKYETDVDLDDKEILVRKLHSLMNKSVPNA